MTLSANIDKHLLRGIGIHYVMANLGRIWARTANGVDQKVFNSSRPVDKVDYFVSHSWSSDAWVKHFVLCLIFNARAAVCGSHLIGSILAVGQAIGYFSLNGVEIRDLSDPGVGGQKWQCNYGVLCSMVCPCLFWLILLFWQNIRLLAGFRPATAFVDKCCVNQNDTYEKTQAIRGLAGILRHSDELIVLWSPIYFTRLWCMYEIASWLHLRKSFSTIRFVPLSYAKFVFLGWMLFFITCQAMITLNINMVFLMIGLFFYFAFICKGKQDLGVLSRLPNQIRAFSLDMAQCTCCTLNHVVPGTEECIPCDGELLVSTLQEWFPGKRQGAATSFEEAMRGDVGKWVLKCALPTNLPYWWIHIMLTPFVWLWFDTCGPLLRALPTDLALRFLIGDILFTLATFPFMIKVVIYLIVRADALFGSQLSMVKEMGISVVITLIHFLHSVIHVKIHYDLISLSGPFPFLLYATLIILVTCFLFCSCNCRSSHRGSADIEGSVQSEDAEILQGIGKTQSESSKDLSLALALEVESDRIKDSDLTSGPPATTRCVCPSAEDLVGNFKRFSL